MLILLLVILFIFAFFSYYTSGKDYLSPTFVLCCFFIAINIFSIVANTIWKEDIYIEIIGVFIISIFSLWFGERLSSLFVKKSFDRKVLPVFNINTNKIKKEFSMLIIVQLVLLVMLYVRITELLANIGYSGELFLKYSRMLIIDYGVSYGVFYTIFLPIIDAIAFIAIYMLVIEISNNRNNMKKVLLINYKYLISIVLAIIKSLITGARTGMIQLICGFAIIYLIVNNRNRKINIYKVVFTSSLYLIIILYALLLVGAIRKSANNSMIDSLFVYTGSSIIALNKWLQNPSKSIYFGQETFWGIRHTLNKLGFNVISFSQHLEMIYLKGLDGKVSTNVYTAYRSFISDFGIIGLITINFLIGFFISYFYRKIKCSYYPVSIILYGYFFFYFIYMIFTANITTSLFTSGQILSVMWIIIICKYVIKFNIKV